MKYSIVLPTYTNTKEHLKIFWECLMSVHANSNDAEIILVNDGSLFSENIEKSKSLITTLVEHSTNKGIPVSWNDGLKIARGEYIVVINDDITVTKGWLDKLRMALEDDDSNFVAAPGVKGKQNGHGIEENYQWYPGYCFMVKRATIDQIGFFDEQFSPFNFEDTDYWTRVLMAGKKLVRNYSTTITHHEGHVLHTLKYEQVSERNKKKFINKWGFDPIPVFYYGKEAPWNK